jgi:hypothetical protein
MEHKWVGIEMSIFRMGTKLQAVLSVAFLLVVSLSSIFALQVTYSDTGVTYDVAGIISNSKGHYWAATAANLRLAIFDLNSTSGGIVQLPTGTITFTSPLIPINHLNLVGAGDRATILKIGTGFSDPAGYGLIKCLDGGGFNNITISDMTINGNGLHIPINMYDVKDINFHDLILLNASGNAIGIVGDGNYRIKISDVQIYNTKTYHAISFIRVNDSIIDNIIIGNSTGAGSQPVDLNGCNNISVSNIIVKNMGSAGIKIVESKNIDFNNIFIINVAGDGFKIQNCNRVNINNLHIDTTSADNGLTMFGSSYINMNNIYIANSKTNGVYIFTSGSFININNLIVKNAGAQGIGLDSLNNITISNAQILSPALYNSIYTCKDFSVTQSKFNGAASTFGLEIWTGCSRFSVTYCEFLNNANDGIDLTGGTANNNYSIIGCYFKGNALGVDCHTSDDYIIITENFFIGDALDDHYSSKGYVEKNIGDDI